MFISQALTELLGRPDRFAWRPTGEILQVTNRGGIKRVGRGGPVQFVPKVTDLMSDDWRVGTKEQLVKSLTPDAAEKAA